MDFKGKTALVTGAAGAIGKGVAAGFLSACARVFITDLDQKAVDDAVQELTLPLPPPAKRGGNSTVIRTPFPAREGGDKGGAACLGLAADVTNAQQVAEVVSAASRAFGGRIDILVNVAGIVGQGKVEDIAEADWDRMFAVNCKGSFLFIKHVVPLMKAHRYGKIINFSSKSGKTGSALMCHYSAAKSAIIGLTQALAYELAGHGITVNCLCPGITDHTGVWKHVSAGYIENLKLPREQVVKKFTEKIPLQRLASIADVVAVTLFLASPGADYMTGQAINVTGGREMH